LMAGHISVGRKYPQITQLLLYSYGVDDQEFIVSYETDDLSDFQSLVIELRSDAVREYTLNDTPIFTCIYKPLEEMINFI
jgi:chlorite dismutase